MCGHILIATDGSELADRGARHGLALAKQLGAKVTVPSVTEALSPVALEAALAGGVCDPLVSYDMQMDEDVRKIDRVVAPHAKEPGVDSDLARETDNSAADVIWRFAQLKNCDLIVMVSHGRRGLNKLLVGSQTASVLARATLPVLVIRRPMHEGA